MKARIGIIIFIMAFLSCSKQDNTSSGTGNSKTTGHIYCQLKLGNYNYGYGYGYGGYGGNNYTEVQLDTFDYLNRPGIYKSKSTTNGNAKLDFGELPPRNYAFAVTNFYNYKVVKFKVSAGFDQTIDITW